MKNIILLGLLSVVVASCVQLPRPVSLPWNQQLSTESILPGSSVFVDVQAEASPLIGSEFLVSEEIKNHIQNQLIRRGFSISSNQNSQYQVKIIYATERGTQTQLSATSYNDRPSFISFQSAVAGWGVMLAQSMMLRASINATSSTTMTNTVTQYQHQVSCEISTWQNQLIWQSRTVTQSTQKSILDVYLPMTQIALSGLPSTGDYIPRVLKLKPERLPDFYKTNLIGYEIVCPALARKVKFVSLTSQTYGTEYVPVAIKGLQKENHALIAVLDLMQTAEYAIPSGSEKNWKNPTDSRIWSNPVIIGKYYLGNDKYPINVVLSLKSSSESYLVDECELVSDSAYSVYKDKYARWTAFLSDYYNFYE